MKLEALNKRLDKGRPMTEVTLRIPEDIIDDLKRIAPRLGFSGYQSLIRAYIGRGLREDLDGLDDGPVTALVEALKRKGVSEELIATALAEASPPVESD